MKDRQNTINGWILFAGIVALGGSIVSGEVFKAERPEKMGYPIEGVVAEGEGGEAAKPIEFYLASADAAKGEQVFKKCTACHNADQGGANALGPNLWGVRRRSRIGGPCRLRLFRRAEGRARQLGLQGARRLAGQPEEICAGHQDDLRRPRQPRGPRQRHRLPERAQRCDLAASGRPGRSSRTGAGDKAAAEAAGAGAEKAENEPVLNEAPGGQGRAEEHAAARPRRSASKALAQQTS